MPKFRKKPVVIDAMQWSGEQADLEAIADFMWGVGEVGAVPYHTGRRSLLIDTLEGNMEALPSDWIIKGIAGEHYPCKPEIFAATYEPVQ